MRELLSLRRDEAPIIGEVYLYKNEYLKCVADKPGESCAKCAFDETTCGCLCDAKSVFPLRHFETVSESVSGTDADIKFRHIEETQGEPPFLGERFIAAIGLVEYVETQNRNLCSCAQCDLTQRECNVAVCGVNCHYKRILQ